MGFSITREKMLDIGRLTQARTDKYLTIISDVVRSPRDPSKQDTIQQGTGCYFSYGGLPFILTAKHVIDSDNVEVSVHSRSSGDKPFPLRSGWVSPQDIDADIAIYGCFQKALDDSGVETMSYSELLVPSFNHHDSFYYCNGYPGVNTLSLPFMGEASFTGNPFIGKQTTLPRGYNEDIHFAIEYPCTTHPGGMSGSPIWNLRIHCMDNLDAWNPDAVSFAGVVHTWHRETQKLIVTKVEFVRDFVPNGILFLKEKYGWKNGNE